MRGGEKERHVWQKMTGSHQPARQRESKKVRKGKIFQGKKVDKEKQISLS